MSLECDARKLDGCRELDLQSFLEGRFQPLGRATTDRCERRGGLSGQCQRVVAYAGSEVLGWREDIHEADLQGFRCGDEAAP